MPWNIISNRDTEGSSGSARFQGSWTGLKGSLVCFPKLESRLVVGDVQEHLWSVAEVLFSKPNAQQACCGQLPHSDTSLCMCMCLWLVLVCKHTDFPSGVYLFFFELPMFFRPCRWDCSAFSSFLACLFPEFLSVGAGCPWLSGWWENNQGVLLHLKEWHSFIPHRDTGNWSYPPLFSISL